MKNWCGSDYLGAAENVFPVRVGVSRARCVEGTRCVLLSVLAIHSEMVSRVKVEITNCKEMEEARAQ